jgi:hypothetical protein
MHQEPNPLGSLSRPGEPTNAAPGSERKIRIMTERAGRREPLFHPRDGFKKTPRFALPLLVELSKRMESA